MITAILQQVTRALKRRFLRDTLILQIGKIGVLSLGVLSSVIIPVLVGISTYGTWQLTVSLQHIWQVFNLTGIATSTQTRLAIIVGRQDTEEVLQLIAFATRVTLLYHGLSTLIFWGTGSFIIHYFYSTTPQVVYLAVWLNLSYIPESLFQLFMIIFNSCRQMREVALLSNINQLVLLIITILAAIINPTVTSLVFSRILYSILTLLLACWLYQRSRNNGILGQFPSIPQIIRTIPKAHQSNYWQFGIMNALDKNISNLYTQIPVQMAGMILGINAAGYVALAIKIIQQPNFLTSSILDTMKAVIPNTLGQGRYQKLWQQFMQIWFILWIVAVSIYVPLFFFTPFIIYTLYGTDWLPIIPLVQLLTIYGMVTTVGGIFGPLYRALDIVILAFFIKCVATVISLPIGYYLMMQQGVIGATWTVNLLFMISVAITMVVTLGYLHSLRLKEISQ